MIGIVYSSADPASKNIYRQLSKLLDNTLRDNIFFYEFPEEVIFADKVDRELPKDVKYIVMLSKHSATSNMPTISVHSPGNFTDTASMGGRPKEVPLANPCLIGRFLKNLSQLIGETNYNYIPTLEVTHHGPTDIRLPITFIEIGPNEQIWNDKLAGYLAAKALLSSLFMENDKCIKVVGFGGPHYAPIFTNLILKGDYGIGHIVSKYVLTSCDKDIIDMAVEKNGGVDIAVINWKGLKGGVRQCVYSYLIGKNLNVEKI